MSTSRDRGTPITVQMNGKPSAGDTKGINQQPFSFYALTVAKGCDSIFAPYYIQEGKEALDNWINAVIHLETMIESVFDTKTLSQAVTRVTDKEYKDFREHYDHRNKIFAEVSASKYASLLTIAHKKLWSGLLDKIDHKDNLDLLDGLSKALSDRRQLQMNLDPLVEQYYKSLQGYIANRRSQIVNFSSNPINLTIELERQLTEFPKYQKKFEDAQQTIKRRLSPSLTSISSPSLTPQSSPSSLSSRSEEKSQESGVRRRRYDCGDEDPFAYTYSQTSSNMFPAVDSGARQREIERLSQLPDEVFQSSSPKSEAKKQQQVKQPDKPACCLVM